MKCTVSAPRPDLAPPIDFEAYERFARTALDCLSAGDHADARALRRQLSTAELVEPEYTGAGFFLTLGVPPGCDLLSRDGEIGDVQGDRSDRAHPIGVVLFVRNGLAATLEAFGYGDWPDDVSNYRLGYIRWRAIGNGATAERTDVRDAQSFWGPNLEA